MQEDLDRQDARLRAEADALLDRGVRALLAEYAEVHVTGSYALHLMTWRDLDVYLEAADLSVDRFLDLGRRLAVLLRPWKMTFNDHRQRPAEGGLQGLYWGLRIGDLERGGWKLDLWAFDPTTCRERLEHVERTHRKLTTERRQAILRLKDVLWRHPEYRKTITSQEVYDAVCDAGVEDLEGFWAYHRSRSSASAKDSPR